MSDIARRIGNLPPEKLDLLLQRLTTRHADQPQPDRIPRIPREPNAFPLSLAQQRLWFLEQLLPGTAIYNIPHVQRLSGALDVAALEQALATLQRRHETLRTTFHHLDGRPVQVIAPAPAATAREAPLPLPVIDLRDVPADAREAEAMRRIDAAIQQPFDLARGPLWRVHLLRLAKDPRIRGDHLLLLVMHHLIADGWSFGVITRELAQLYAAHTSGAEVALPDLAVQYVDVAHWQHTRLHTPADGGAESPLQQQLAYWKQQLGSDPPVLDLPTDHPRPAFQSYRGAHAPIDLPRPLTHALKALSQQEGVSLFMTLLAALNVLLFRYTGQTDICLGTPIANRTHPELEPLIGCFVNTLVLRTDLAGNPSFRELLGRVREVALGAYAHQDLPFEKLVEELQPDRDLSRTPLFQVLFVQLDAPATTLRLPGLTLSPLPVHTHTAQYDLSFYLTEGPDGLSGFIEYSTDLFERATIARMAGHLTTLLEGIVDQPDQRIADLPLLTVAEQQQLLVTWNATQRPYPAAHCLHQLFEAQVERTPDDIAVVAGDAHLTYRELNRRANQLAHHLRARGVGPETLVGICVERSLEMLVGLLGILKAGGAYVPLDPAFPAERLALMLEDARVPVLLTQRSIDHHAWTTERQPPTAPAQELASVYLDADWPTIARAPDTNPVNLTSPENLAYTIYTSGSTGRPKGVQIPHRALVNFLNSMAREPGLTARDTLVAVTTLSFDIAGLELFLPLILGARLVIAERDVAADGIRLAELLARSGATVMQATPATWRLLLAAGWQSTPQLKILCGGEALPRELANQLAREGVAVWNLYGPTETTIWSATCRVEPGEGPISIGHPIDNTQLYVLDAHLQPVPIGVPGELYIGGDGLARGYFNRPDLTAEKFVPNPFAGGEMGRWGDTPIPPISATAPQLHTSPPLHLSTSPPPHRHTPSRLYRTGDLVRYRADGSIEFLSRIDHQVKVRGFRIELGDIETALGQHPAVSQNVVVVREDTPGDKRLVAYVVVTTGAGAGGDGPPTGELRAFLKTRLPEYMLPAAFVFLDAMPLTPNGKVNRRALPAPDQDRTDLERSFVAPRTPTEAALAAIWSQVLNVPRIGIHDNFFELGGHSLLATQLIFRLRSDLQVDLPVRTFFEAPTVAGMARAVEAQRQNGSSTPRTAAAAIDLRAEAVLDPAIRAEGAQPAARPFAPQSIFLTGATGFLGAFLLRELLERTPARITCLVRAASVERGRARIRAALETYLLWDEALADRIMPMIGDLSRPRFGLSEAQFQQLAEEIDVIYHSGAVTSFIYPYATLKAPNVLGTQEVLRLASRSILKPVHFISTLSVFSPLDQAARAVIGEADLPEHCEALATGYTQSKWVAERLALEARARDLPICIYRPGRIAGHSRTGACQTDDFAWRMIKACVEAGSVPDLDMRVDMTPMDYVSRAIAHLAHQPASVGNIFHLINPDPPHLDELADWMRASGYPLERVAYEQWHDQLVAIAERSPDSAAYTLIPFLSAHRAEMEVRDPRFDQQNTRAGLANSDIAYIPIDQHVFETYLTYYVTTGFLEAPVQRVHPVVDREENAS